MNTAGVTSAEGSDSQRNNAVDRKTIQLLFPATQIHSPFSLGNNGD